MSTTKQLYVVNADRLAYGPAFDLQREIVAARKAGAVPDVLLFVEHPPVITLGRNGETKNLLASSNVLKQMNVEFAETDRGGDITYHGPGQIVGYPILDLTQHKRDVRWYVEQLEEVMIRTAADYSLHARRVLCRHGIWIDPPSHIANSSRAVESVPEARRRAAQRVSAAESAREPSPVGATQLATTNSDANLTLAPDGRHSLAQPGRAGDAHKISPSAVGPTQTNSQACTPATDGPEEKLAALGVHLSRWVTSHGFAFNVSTDLRFFDLIIPCGIQGKRATSLERALGRPVSTDEARARLTTHFAEIFHAQPESIPLDDFRHALKQETHRAK